MHVLALLQQAQVQRAAQDALECLDKQSLQDEAASEQLQVLALKVRISCGGNMLIGTKTELTH